MKVEYKQRFDGFTIAYQVEYTTLEIEEMCFYGDHHEYVPAPSDDSLPAGKYALIAGQPRLVEK